MSKNQTPKEILHIRDNNQELRSISGNEWVLRKSMSAHWHSFVEIDMVIGGEGEQVLNGECMKLERGVITVIKPTDWHSITITSPISFIHIAFDEKSLTSEICDFLYRQTSNLCVHFDADRYKQQNKRSLPCSIVRF